MCMTLLVQSVTTKSRSGERIEEHPQSVGGYLTLMRVHLTNAEAAWAGSDNDTDALHCLRKVLALGVACGEQHGLPKRDFNNYPE